MKNIHLFETKNAYDEAKSGLILPTVSYIKENQDVKYNPVFDANGHDFVEINGVKWATMNVGAKSIYDYGLYFQWGDTQGYTSGQVGTSKEQKTFSEEDYNSELLTKYNKMGMTLESVDDAVHAAWKGSWRMPTTEDFKTLSENVTTTFVTDYNKSGVAGLVCTAEDGKQLFFPACGYAHGGSMFYVGSNGRYWSSSLNSSSVDYAYDLGFSVGFLYWQDYYYRYDGFTVRGVLAEN